MRWLTIFYFLASACSNSPVPLTYPDTINPPDIQKIDKGPDTHEQDCVRVETWFCPSLGGIWGKYVKKDICHSPPLILEESACQEIFECNPSEYKLGLEDCVTEGGQPGEKQKYCDKGHYIYGPCEPLCGEEICNGLDDDCDGEIDEGQLNACGQCGQTPYEICDGHDNDCDGETDEYLISECSTLCEQGWQECQYGNWVNCTAQQPTTEICDGLDNNCNGFVDEDLDCLCTKEQVGSLFPCSQPPLICGQGFIQCVCKDQNCNETVATECHALCWHYPIPNEVCHENGIIIDETCNNFDDDCDELIDENLLRTCYSGSPKTLDMGTCKAGEQTCHEGLWGGGTPFMPGACPGEVLPAPVDNCNGDDENCDGLIDGGKKIQPTDIVFIVDWSGSMLEEINAVSTALLNFSKYYNDEEVLLWAYVAGPVTKLSNDRLLLLADLVPFEEFLQAITGIGLGTGGGSEMLLDALWLVLDGELTPGTAWSYQVDESDPPLQDFKVTWRPNTDKLIIVWTDEEPQSFLIPSIDIQELEELIAASSKLTLHIFSEQAGATDWEALALAGNGKHHYLSTDPEQMYFALIDIFNKSFCQ